MIYIILPVSSFHHGGKNPAMSETFSVSSNFNTSFPLSTFGKAKTMLKVKPRGAEWGGNCSCV